MHRNPGKAMLNLCTYEQRKRFLAQAFCFASLVLLLWTLVEPTVALAQDVSVRAELSAPTITRDESVTLSITAVAIDAELDASALDKDFDVVGRSSSRQISTVIGADNRAVKTSVVTWTLELLPRGKGVFTVPAVKVGDYETQLLTLTVNDVPEGAKRDVFLEASVDTTTPWVQSQVLMTLKVFQAIDIVDGGLDIPSADNLVVERIGEDKRERAVRDGREYSVTERRFALFPQKSGPLTIDPVTLSVTIPAEPERVRGFFSPTRKLTRRSDPITLNVQARPPSGSGWWLPATNLTLSSQWQGDPDTAQVDQPLTRTLIMRAEGVLESQLPQISIPAIEGLSLYAEDPVLAMGGTESGLVAEQRINWALIPQRSGTLMLPAIKLEWFNTLTGRTETAELPEETITIEAASAKSANAQGLAGTDQSSTASNNVSAGESSSALSDSIPITSTEPGNDASADVADSLIAANQPSLQNSDSIEELRDARKRWQLLAVAALGLWSLTLVGWLIAYRRSTAGIDSGNGPIAEKSRWSRATASEQIDSLYQKLAPMNQIDKACKQADLLDIKRAVLEWAARQWPKGSFTTLDSVQTMLPQGAASEKLSQLQIALYSKKGYSEIMPTLADDMASFPDDLKSALQQGEVDAAANDNDVSSLQGRSRLPPL